MPYGWKELLLSVGLGRAGSCPMAGRVFTPPRLLASSGKRHYAVVRFASLVDVICLDVPGISFTLMDQTDAAWLEGIAPVRLSWSCLQLPHGWTCVNTSPTACIIR